MSDDVLITPASRKIEFKDSSGNVDGKIELDSTGNLVLTSPGGGIELGDSSSDIFVGNGSANIDIIFEQNGEIRGTTGRTVTLGQSDSNIAVNALNFTSGGNEVMTSASVFPSGTTTTGLPTAGALNLANPPENDNHVFHPYLHNDLGHFIERGGTYAWAGLSSNPTETQTKRLFNANDDFVQIVDSAISGTTYTLTLTNLPKGLYYSAYAGIVFCHDNFAPGSMVIETSTNGGSSYTTRLTDSSSKVVYACTFDSGASATNAIRFTFSAAPGSGEVRISTITAYDYNSSGMENYFLPLRGGIVYGNVNLKGAVTINDAYTLPTADGNNAQVLATNGSGTISFQSVGSLAGSGIQNVSDDTSPQLGGNLATSGNNIQFGDSSGSTDDRLQFGNSQDLQIWHAGTNSFIQDSGTGDLYIQSGTVHITDTSSTASGKFIDGGAVELYHNGTKKFETDSFGVTVTGRLNTTSHIDINNSNGYARIELGGSSGAFIDMKSPNSDDFDHRIITTGTGAPTLQLQSDDFHLMNKSGTENYLDATNNGAVNLYHNNVKKFETTSDGATISGDLTLTKSSGDTKLFIEADSDNDTEGDNAFIVFKQDGGIETSAVWTGNFGGSNDNALNLTNSGQYGGGIRFGTTATNGAWETATERMRIDRIGDITIFGTNGDIKFDYSADTLTFEDNIKAVFGTGGDLEISHTGSHSVIKEGGTGQLRIQSSKLHVLNSNNSESMLVATENGSVDLYHNDVKKFETTSAGATVTGTLTTTSGITFSDGTTQTSAGASTGFSIAMATALG